jgi:hypothetical protein
MRKWSVAYKRSTRLLVLTGMSGVILLATVAGVIGALQGKPQIRIPTSTTAPTTTTTVVALAPLGAAGKELDQLAAAGRSAKVHATYSVTDSQLPEGLIQTVEIWREGNRFRSDIIERASNGTRRQTALFDGTSRRSCETRNGTQTCEVTAVDPVDLPTAFIRAVDAAKPKPKLTARSEIDIAGFQARCFEAPKVGELCLTTDGVMLRLVLKGATIEATRLEDDVPEAAFDVSG